MRLATHRPSCRRLQAVPRGAHDWIVPALNYLAKGGCVALLAWALPHPTGARVQAAAVGGLLARGFVHARVFYGILVTCIRMLWSFSKMH